MDDNDVNIFKSLGFGVEENVTILTLVVFKGPFIIRMIEQWKLGMM